MPIGPARMPLMDHLGELRMRLVRIVVVLLVAICIFYMATPTMGQFLLLPIADCLPADEAGNAVLSALDPFESFGTRFKIALWASIVACMPIILWQILAFFLPALKPKERKWFVPTFAAAVALFIFGTIFCYFVILHPAFLWLTDQAAGLGVIEPRMSSYIDMIIKFEIGFGFAFELPLIIFYLALFDIIPYKKLRASWRIVYVALMIISAMVTPDASPVTMLLMFAAMVALYELSLLIARIALRRRLKKKQEEQAQQDADIAYAKQVAGDAKDAALARLRDFDDDAAEEAAGAVAGGAAAEAAAGAMAAEAAAVSEQAVRGTAAHAPVYAKPVKRVVTSRNQDAPSAEPPSKE